MNSGLGLQEFVLAGKLVCDKCLYVVLEPFHAALSRRILRGLNTRAFGWPDVRLLGD
jgi:hypothetical protein